MAKFEPKRHYENAKIRKKKEKTEKSSKKVIFIPKSPYIYKKKTDLRQTEQ